MPIGNEPIDPDDFGAEQFIKLKELYKSVGIDARVQFNHCIIDNKCILRVYSSDPKATIVGDVFNGISVEYEIAEEKETEKPKNKKGIEDACITLSNLFNVMSIDAKVIPAFGSGSHKIYVESIDDRAKIIGNKIFGYEICYRKPVSELDKEPDKKIEHNKYNLTKTLSFEEFRFIAVERLALDLLRSKRPISDLSYDDVIRVIFDCNNQELMDEIDEIITKEKNIK